jgi:hypothetical protein
MADPPLAQISPSSKLRLKVGLMKGDDMQQWIDKLYSFSPETIEREKRFSSTD